MSKFTGVKGVKGLRKLMKEIAVTASTGKHDNEIIGTVNIPLKVKRNLKKNDNVNFHPTSSRLVHLFCTQSIPASGQMKWYNIEKKPKPKCQGTIKLKMVFSAEKNSQVAAQEHRHLLRLLMLHELENNKVWHMFGASNVRRTGFI